MPKQDPMLYNRLLQGVYELNLIQPLCSKRRHVVENEDQKRLIHDMYNDLLNLDEMWFQPWIRAHVEKDNSVSAYRSCLEATFYHWSNVLSLYSACGAYHKVPKWFIEKCKQGLDSNDNFYSSYVEQLQNCYNESLNKENATQLVINNSKNHDTSGNKSLSTESTETNTLAFFENVWKDIQSSSSSVNQTVSDIIHEEKQENSFISTKKYPTMDDTGNEEHEDINDTIQDSNQHHLIKKSLDQSDIIQYSSNASNVTSQISRRLATAAFGKNFCGVAYSAL